jgi:hypothetical protein
MGLVFSDKPDVVSSGYNGQNYYITLRWRCWKDSQPAVINHHKHITLCIEDLQMVLGGEGDTHLLRARVEEV